MTEAALMDSSVIIDYQRGFPPAVNYMDEMQEEELLRCSIVTYAELLYHLQIQMHLFWNQPGVSRAFFWLMKVATPRVNQLSPSKPKTRWTFSQKGRSTSVI